MPRSYRSQIAVALAAMALFVLPMALFLYKFRIDAPFYFLAQDSFYYLSIALHSAHTPFFSIDGLHPTNGFHPLWEVLEYTLAKLPFFRLDGPAVLPRIFAMDLAIVGLAVGLLSAYTYRLTRRPWLSILAFCPGLLWLLVGIGAPAYLNLWASVNGMETGLELLFLGVSLLLLGPRFPSGLRLWLACFTLGALVLSRLDDVFFLLAIAIFIFLTSPATDRPRRLVPFAIPVLMIAVYLLYNHRTVGVWLPVSGMAKVGKGYRAGIGETLHLLEGWPFFALDPQGASFYFSNTFVMVAQMFAPMIVAALWLLWRVRRIRNGVSPVLQALALGVLFKGSYNFLRVPLGYQGAWYYGVSIATANLLIADFLAVLFQCWSASTTAPATSSPRHLPTALTNGVRLALMACLTFLSFNITAARASLNGSASVRDAWLEAAPLRRALQQATSAPFLEFQDGELSFATGLPAVSGFGLAADPEAVRAQRAGTYFQLLERRGITIAAASNTYPPALAVSARSKAIFPIWGFNRQEIQGYCFEPFWNDPKGNIVLYRIRHQSSCPGYGP